MLEGEIGVRLGRDEGQWCCRSHSKLTQKKLVAVDIELEIRGIVCYSGTRGRVTDGLRTGEFSGAPKNTSKPKTGATLGF